jgi:hypothetical protein
VTVRAPPLTPELVEQRLSELQQLSRLGASLVEAALPPIDRRILERRSLRIAGRAPGHVSDARDIRLHVLAVAIDRQLGWMPDAWVDPTSGEVVGVGLALLAGALVDERAVDALARGREGTVILRFLVARPACVDALPLLEHADQHARLWLSSRRDRSRTRW